MKCEQCGESQAEVVLRVCLDGETLETRYLCRACLAAQEGAEAEARKKKGGRKAEPRAVEDLACPSCGLHFAEFCRSGHLGCEDCYIAFEAHLTTLLRQTRGADYFERDFFPERTEGSRALQEELAELERALGEAVREERYEIAAQIRDEMQMLKAALGRQ